MLCVYTTAMWGKISPFEGTREDPSVCKRVSVHDSFLRRARYLHARRIKNRGRRIKIDARARCARESFTLEELQVVKLLYIRGAFAETAL